MSAGVGPWRGWMRQRIRIAARTGQDVNGKPTYGTPKEYMGRIVGRRRKVWDAQGREMVSGQTAYLATADVILPDAKVTLSTGDVASTETWALNPPIIDTGTYPDERGANVYTALFLARGQRS